MRMDSSERHRRQRQPTPVPLPGKSHGQRGQDILGRLNRFSLNLGDEYLKKTAAFVAWVMMQLVMPSVK